MAGSSRVRRWIRGWQCFSLWGIIRYKVAGRRYKPQLNYNPPVLTLSPVSRHKCNGRCHKGRGDTSSSVPTTRVSPQIRWIHKMQVRLYKWTYQSGVRRLLGHLVGTILTLQLQNHVLQHWQYQSSTLKKTYSSVKNPAPYNKYERYPVVSLSAFQVGFINDFFESIP
jgi:hypothetical protein